MTASEAQLPEADLPYVGPALLSKKNDPKSQPRVYCEVKAQTFFTSNEDDIKAYSELLTRVTQGRVKTVSQDKVYNEQQRCWQIFLVWQELYLGPPNESQNTGKLPQPAGK